MKTNCIRILSVFVMILGTTALIGQGIFDRWLEDDHYLLRENLDGETKYYKVNPQSGSRSDAEEPALTVEDRFMRGERTDAELQVMVRENDLFFEGQKITNDRALEQNPQLSPDALRIAYTKRGNLFVYDVLTKRHHRLTDTGSDKVYNGYASWVYYEEILGRGSNYRAFYWSPDGKHLAFLQFDDRPVPTFTLERSEGINGHTEVLNYPKPGDPNPRARLGIVNVETQVIIWVDEDSEKDQYTAFVFWTPDGSSVLFQELNRDQDTLDLIRYDIADGSRHHILQETRPTWVKFVEEIKFSNDGLTFWWPSERTGWQNWYRYDLKGSLLGSLTDQPFDLDLVSMYDDTIALLSGAGTSTTDQHLFLANLKNGKVRQVTSGHGSHLGVLSPNARYIKVSHSAFDQPSQSFIVDAMGNKLQSFSGGKDHNAKEGIELKPFSVEVDGYALPGYMVYPKGFDPSRKYPVVFSVYGGPASQSVRNRYRSWKGDFMVENGIIRVAIDHRGSGKFGKKGLDEMHRNLGTHEIDDLVEVVKWLREHPYVDGNRIGITGGSYGGYVTAMALTYGADYFTHGVSLFPVTDWQLYDNIYTERYMDTPASNPVGYAQGSAMTHAANLKGKLLLVHGMADDNVHAQNTMQLIAEFQKLGKTFELMVYPGKRHGWGGPEQLHLRKLTEDFWTEHLLLE